MTSDRSPDPLHPSPDSPSALDEIEVSALIAEAGRRPAVPAEDFALIRVAARQEWERVVAAEGERRPSPRLAPPMALAAGLLLAAAAVWFLRSPQAAEVATPLATVARLAGRSWTEGSASSERLEIHRGTALAAGAIVVTDGAADLPGHLALRYPSGASVRLDSGTRARLVSATRLVLDSGAVYVDSGPAVARSPALAVETPFGTVRDIGTQFEVRLTGAQGGSLRVRVREGEVAVARAEGTRRVLAGGELTVGSDGWLRQGSTDSQGPDWAWVQAAAPSFEIEGRSLSDFLAWVARETNWRLHYEDPGLAGMAPTVVLHGTIDGMTPAESLDAVLPGSGLAYRIEDGTLWVTR